MIRKSLTGLSRKQLRNWLILFFLALAIPAAILGIQAYSQLKWESFHLHRSQAEELSDRINRALTQLIETEESRSFTDYAFLNVSGKPSAGFIQRSPLSAFPVDSAIPGLVGYFQMDTDGFFSTPLVPEPGSQSGLYGITDNELTQRQTQQDTIRKILYQNRLVASYKPAAPTLPVAKEKRTDKHPGVARTIINGSPGKDRDSPKRLTPNDVTATPGGITEQARGQAAFDLLNKPTGERSLEKKKKSRLGRIEDLKLDYSYQKTEASAIQQQRENEKAAIEAGKILSKKKARKERGALPAISTGMYDESSPAMAPQAYSIEAEEITGKVIAGAEPVRIHTFESEIDPLEFALLDSGHFVLFRKVWKEDQRYIQGILLDQNKFLNMLVESDFHKTALSDMSKLIVAYQESIFIAYGSSVSRDYLSSAKELEGDVLYQARLSSPFAELELIFSVTRLPAGPGAALIAWLAVILAVVLFGGFFLMYRLGSKQIELANQQQDFVSAVSHELKTPLTSIRMYGEMLREGWAAEEKKQEYYEYIHDESERLSRLISNVLQLARLTHNELQIEIKQVPINELLDSIRSRLASQIERAGFQLNLDFDDKAGKATVMVDADSFIQIIINLVDNAIKFSASAEHKTIDIECRVLRNNRVQFNVRDYGPGVAQDQIKKIFKLFYRSGNELTRETVGTGIGLALVHQLVLAMGGTIDVVNRKPGVEFQVYLQSQDAEKHETA
jgi:signal transduction histidine kinase